jgi:hypothetical protein
MKGVRDSLPLLDRIVSESQNSMKCDGKRNDNGNGTPDR